MKREFLSWAECSKRSYFQRIGSALGRCVRRLFHDWHRVRDGTLTRRAFKAAMRPLRKRFLKVLRLGKACGDLRLQGKCRDLWTHRKALFTFVDTAGIEPTNNRAEQALRHPVILRKTSFGTASHHGSRFIERIMTTVQSLRWQQRDVLAFLVDSLRAQGAEGAQAPSLLPA